MGIARSTYPASVEALAIRRRRLERLYGAPTHCYLCGGTIGWESGELDHIEARVWGGSDEPFNRAWACITCNRMKRDHDLDTFLDRIEWLYHVQDSQDPHLARICEQIGYGVAHPARYLLPDRT